MTELEKCIILKDRGYTYDPLSGYLIGKKGIIIGHNKAGYIIVNFNFNDKCYCIMGHRLAWYLYYNYLPTNIIDHKNRIKDDNKISNLRLSTKSENGFNTNAKGYSYHKASKKYKVSITVNYKYIYIGLFDSTHEARNAYLEAKKKYHIFKTENFFDIGLGKE